MCSKDQKEPSPEARENRGEIQVRRRTRVGAMPDQEERGQGRVGDAQIRPRTWDCNEPLRIRNERLCKKRRITTSSVPKGGKGGTVRLYDD